MDSNSTFVGISDIGGRAKEEGLTTGYSETLICLAESFQSIADLANLNKHLLERQSLQNKLRISITASDRKQHGFFSLELAWTQ